MPFVKRSNNQTKWRNRLYLGLSLVILVFFVINFVRAWFQNFQVNREIAGLKQEITGLEQENSKYTELIQYLNSTAYIEERARVDLGLKKAGEKVVLIPTEGSAAVQQQAAGNQTPESNPRKWLNRFFQ